MQASTNTVTLITDSNVAKPSTEPRSDAIVLRNVTMACGKLRLDIHTVPNDGVEHAESYEGELCVVDAPDAHERRVDVLRCNKNQTNQITIIHQSVI